MCGVFGFVSTVNPAHPTGRGPDLDRLRRIALATESRGRHAFGFAWLDRRGRLCMFKAAGRISDQLGVLALARDARWLVGHCRWATHGDPSQNINNHPHPCDGGWLVHNGVIADYEDLVIDHDLAPVSQCDSEVLGLLIERINGPLAERCARAVGRLQRSPLVMLGLWSRPARMLAIRRGNPLYHGADDRGCYLGSLPDYLPGFPCEVPDQCLVEFTHTGACHATPLPSPPSPPVARRRPQTRPITDRRSASLRARISQRAGAVSADALAGGLFTDRSARSWGF
jgi:glucosamine 6-phosphate synthetase-like amidotransferase/phosphosugar isomerase protein